MNKVNILNDLLVNLKNSYSNKNKYAYCKLNSFCINVLWQLYKEELIHDFAIDRNTAKISIKLKYFKNKPLIKNLNLISKPTLQNFSSVNELTKFYRNYDYFFISTSLGILSSRDLKNNLTIGGQVLFGLKLNI